MSQEEANRRRDDRLPVTWVSHLDLLDDGVPLPCQVADVSTAGTRVTCDVPDGLTEGDELMLVIEELGEFAAVIAWLKPGSIGLKIMAGPDLLLKRFAEARADRPTSSPDPLL